MAKQPLNFFKEKTTLLDSLFSRVKSNVLVICDCDGVLTDGKSYYTEHGKMFKAYGAYDMEIIKWFTSVKNWKFLFVTADMNGYEITCRRLKDMALGAKSNLANIAISGNMQQTLSAFMQGPNRIALAAANAYGRAEIVKTAKSFIHTPIIALGDSLSDLWMFELADACAIPANAPSIMAKYVDYVSHKCGGDGAFADIICNLANKI